MRTPLLQYLPISLGAVVVLFGLYSWSIYRPGFPVTEIAGVQIYSVFPWSLVVFGGFGMLLSVRRPAGLLVALGCAAMFDLIGVSIAQKMPDAPLYVLWMLAIGVTFMLERKNVLHFLLHPAFLIYLIVLMKSPSYGNLAEFIFEVLWVCTFFLAFYQDEVHAWLLRRKEPYERAGVFHVVV